MNIDRLLITGLLYSPEPELLERLRQVKVLNHRFSSQNLPVYDRVISYIEKYSQIPSKEVLTSTYPNFNWDPPEDPFQFLIETALNQKNEIQLKESLAAVETALQTVSAQEARDTFLLQAKQFEVSSLNSTDIHIVRDLDPWLDKYKTLRDSDEAFGLPTGFTELDKLTAGIQDGDFWLFASRPGSFKTWFLCRLFATAGEKCDQCNILFFSKEMTKTQIQNRVLAILGSISYNSLRKYQLSDEELAVLQDTVRQKLLGNMIIIGKGEYEKFDASYIKSKIIEYEPRAAYVDGLYLFEDSPGWEDQTGMTRSIRQIALDTEVPIVGTVQLNKKNEIAYSDSYFQDATVIIKMTRELDADDKPTKTVELNVMKYREGESDITTYVTIGFKNMIFAEGKTDPDGESFIMEALEGVNLLDV